MKLHKWITLKHPIICQSILLLVFLLHSKYWHSKYCHQMLLDNWTEQNFWKIKLVFVLVNTCLGLKLLFGISVSPLNNIFWLFLTIHWRTSKCILIWDCPTYLYSSIIHLMEHIQLHNATVKTHTYTHTHSYILTHTPSILQKVLIIYVCSLAWRLKNLFLSFWTLLDLAWLDLTWQRSNLTPRQNHQRGFLSSSTFEIIGLFCFSDYFFSKTDINWQLFFDSFCYYFK
jgi:hypothetical protein